MSISHKMSKTVQFTLYYLQYHRLNNNICYTSYVSNVTAKMAAPLMVKDDLWEGGGGMALC